MDVTRIDNYSFSGSGDRPGEVHTAYRMPTELRWFIQQLHTRCGGIKSISLEFDKDDNVGFTLGFELGKAPEDGSGEPPIAYYTNLSPVRTST